jgi:hypothetical protein
VPAAADDRVTVDEDSADNLLDVLANDIDLGGEPLTITLVSTASHGTVIRNATSLLYTPTANFTGTDYLIYTVSDGVLSDTGMITVTISERDNTIYLPVIMKND